jgi:hypothetical protein
VNWLDLLLGGVGVRRELVRLESTPSAFIGTIPVAAKLRRTYSAEKLLILREDSRLEHQAYRYDCSQFASSR